MAFTEAEIKEFKKYHAELTRFLELSPQEQYEYNIQREKDGKRPFCGGDDDPDENEQLAN